MNTIQNDRQASDSQCTVTIEPIAGETSTAHLKVEEDVPAELEAFVRLSHLGMFDQARRWFEGCLRDHCTQFPVALEYADMLLRQGAYEEVLGLHCPDTIGLPERGDIELLWQLIQGLADMHSGGSGLRASYIAKECFHYLHDRRVGQGVRPSALEASMLEIYLEIVVDYRTSDWLKGRDKYKNPPWCGFDVPAWRGFGNWYANLRHRGHYWEAQRILSILLPALPLKDAIDMFMKPNYFARVVENIDEGSFDENLVLSDLISANNICNYVLEHCNGLVSDGRPLEALVDLAGAYLQSSRSLAAILRCLSKRDEDEEIPPVLQAEMLENKFGQIKKGPLSAQTHSGEALPRMSSFEKGMIISAPGSPIDYTQGTTGAVAPEPLKTLHPDQANYARLHALQQSLASPTAAAPTRYTCASESPSPGNLRHAGPAALQVGLAPVIPRWARSQTVNFAALSDGYPQPELAHIAANALREAAEEWSDLDLGVRFKWVQRIQDASFVLCYGGDHGEAFAQAFFPNGNELSSLVVYAAAFRPGVVRYLKNIFLHELGHVLGFRHEFAPQVYGDNEGIQLGPRDPHSVMGDEFPPQLQASDRESAMAFYRFSGSAIGWQGSNEPPSSNSNGLPIKDYIAR